jgi:hypothetical protein
MEMLIIKQNSQEWDWMWEYVAAHPINEDIQEPSVAINERESWQYMCSFKHMDKIIHTFRHRLHPRFQRTEHIVFNSSETLTPEDIERTLPVK